MKRATSRIGIGLFTPLVGVAILVQPAPPARAQDAGAAAVSPASGEPVLRLSPADGRLAVAADATGRRALLLALAERAGFSVLFADDLPDDPVTYHVDATTPRQFVARLLDEAGLDYVLGLRGAVPGGLRVVVIARRGPALAAAALAEFERRAAEEEQAWKDAELERGRLQEAAEAGREGTSDPEHEPEPANDPLAAPPVVIELPPPPPPIELDERPTIIPLPFEPQPLPVPDAPAWRPVSEDEVMPGRGEAPKKPTRPPGG